MYCRLVPPREKYIPALPYRSANDKLLFPLCRNCADNFNSQKCQHSDSERALEGTWVTEEVKAAVERGYKLDKIHVVMHFKERAKYDKAIDAKGIFETYINFCIKEKQEASGIYLN
jgi:hypothetical protein